MIREYTKLNKNTKSCFHSTSCSCWPNSPRSVLNYHENNSHLSSEHKADKENTSNVSACKTKTVLPSQFNDQMSQYILKHQQQHPPSKPKDGDEMDNQSNFENFKYRSSAWTINCMTRPVRCALWHSGWNAKQQEGSFTRKLLVYWLFRKHPVHEVYNWNQASTKSNPQNSGVARLGIQFW